jgi:hypothetical protein
VLQVDGEIEGDAQAAEVQGVCSGSIRHYKRRVMGGMSRQRKQDRTGVGGHSGGHRSGRLMVVETAAANWC